MRKVELLSPVGNRDMLYQAIHNGADAVYLAGINYGARKFANNFNNEEIIEAINYAHLYGVKVYVTVNTLIYEKEVKDVLDYLGFLHKNGVDAVIMQDIGLIKLVREVYPNLEIHASTQCHNHNKEAIKLWKNLGLNRVVLAREMSLEEINNIDIDIEKEVFVYGALCVCYSGCCLFSSLNGGRSGNRGECVGSCRLPYKLIKNNEEVKADGNFILSTRELNTLSRLSEILKSGITSLKIEGRMKSSEYVGYVTRLYRILIDKYYNNEEVIITEDELINLKKLFNRKFTSGYLFLDNNIMNIKTPNHQGVEIGKILGFYKNKIKVRLDNESLCQNDGIRFKNSGSGMIVNRLYDDKLLLVNEVSKGKICYLDNKFNIRLKDIILKTIDSRLQAKLLDIEEKKIPIVMRVKCLLGNELELEIDDGINKVIVYGEVITRALKREVTKEEILKQLFKLGNTPFKIDSFDIIKDDNIFINLRSLNIVRRDAIDKLIYLRKNINKDNYLKRNRDIIKINKQIKKKIYLSILVRNEEQLKVCLDNKVDYIYVTDYNLYLKYKNNDRVYYRLDRVINNYKSFKNERLLVGEVGSVERYHFDNELIGDYYLNVTNSVSIKFLKDYGVKRVTLSVELDDNQIKDIADIDNDFELIIYGRFELMVMKYCPLKKLLNYCDRCHSSNDKFYLEDISNRRYPMIRNNCLTHIMQDKPINKIDKVSIYKDMGICNYRLELFDEDTNEVVSLINKFYKL